MDLPQDVNELRTMLADNETAMQDLRDERAEIMAAIFEQIGPVELQQELADLSVRLDNAIAAGPPEVYQRSAAVHGRLRAAKRELDKLQPSPEADLLRNEMRLLTERLLREVFSVTG